MTRQPAGPFAAERHQEPNPGGGPATGSGGRAPQRSVAARLAVLAVAASLAVAAGAATAPARADDTVDLQVGLRDRVQGTLRPADEREQFIVAALRGSAVKATLRREGASALIPSMDLVDDATTNVATGTPTSAGAKIARTTVARTALHRFRVTANGNDGDYRLDVTVTPQRVWTARADADLAPGGEAGFTFAAPRGAAVSIDVRAAKGSALRPSILFVAGPVGDAVTFDLPGAPSTRARETIATVADGEHGVMFRNDGLAAGAWTATVRVRAPAPSRRTVDLRDAALTGDFGGTQAVYGRSADPASDTVIDPADGFNLDGATIAIPAGALTIPAVISMSETTSFFVSDASFAAGTAISFSPAGTTFSKAATVTIPFDADAFDDPFTELSIVVEDASTGAQETIFPKSVDLVTGTATFPVSHFSRFQTASPRARPVRGSFVDLEISGRALPGFGAEITFGRNGLLVAKGPRAAGPATRSIRRTTFGWGMTEYGPRIHGSTDERTVAATARIADDGNAVIETPGDDVPLERGRSGEALVVAGNQADAVGLHAVLRVPRGDPTRANLAGAWRAQILDVRVSKIDDASVSVKVGGHEFDVDVAIDGVAKASAAALRVSAQRFPQEAWHHTIDDRAPKPGRLDPDGRDVLLTMTAGIAAIDVARLTPVLGGDLLVGGAAAYVGPRDDGTLGALRLVVLARRFKGDAPRTLEPNLLLHQFVARTETRALAPHPLRFGTLRGGITVAAEGRAHLAAQRTTYGHDGAGLVAMESGPADGSGTVRVAADGTVRAGDALSRARLLPRGSAVFVFGPEKGVFPFGFALPSAPPPAAK